MSSTKKAAPKKKIDLALEEEVPFFDVAARLEKIEGLLNTRFTVGKVSFKIGEEVHVEWDLACTALNKLFVLGYAQQYHLLPPNIPVEILAGMTKNHALEYIPLIIATILRKVDGNTIDVAAPNNLALIAIVDILSWYWYENGGPRPETSNAIKQVKLWSRSQGHYQNEVLSCPLCNKQFAPPENYKTQQSKFWAWVRWLPLHAIEYHRYVKPGTSSKKEPKGDVK